MFLDLRVPPHDVRCKERGARPSSCFSICKRSYPDYGLEFETYVSVPGARIAQDHALVKTIEATTSASWASRQARHGAVVLGCLVMR